MRDRNTITNPNVYSCPDLDSDSDSEEHSPKIIAKIRHRSEQQERNLVKLGCSYNILDEFKRLNFVQNPKCIDQQYDLKEHQHELDLQKEKELIIERQRQKNGENWKKYKTLMSELNSTLLLDDAAQDKDFEEELKRQRKLVDDAIALDKRKSEAESAEAKAKADKIKKEAEEKAEKEKAEKDKAESKLKLEQSSTSPQGLEEYKKHYAKIEYYHNTIRPKLSDPVFAKECFMARKLINRTTAQLQPDHSNIMAKYNVISPHLMSIKQKSSDAFEVMLNALAKVVLKLVRKEVDPSPHTVYYLARFSFLICVTVPEFLDYLLARLFKRCPYLIPQYHDDDLTLSQKEIMAKRRYCLSDKENKVMETFLQHAVAQKCFVMFYGALCQTLPDPGQPENPYPIKHAWVYLARICNMPLRDITPYLILGILEVAGQRLLEAYPHQTPKLFRLIRQTIMPGFPKRDEDTNSAIGRIEIVLESYFNTGRVECIPEST